MLEPRIGELRNFVDIAYRTEGESTSTAGLSDVYTIRARAWAKIEPVGTAIYVNSMQTTSLITHRIWLRWIPIQDYYNVILNSSILPNGRVMNQRFQTQRVSEVGQIHRWLLIEAMEEQQLNGEVNESNGQ